MPALKRLLAGLLSACLAVSGSPAALWAAATPVRPVRHAGKGRFSIRLPQRVSLAVSAVLRPQAGVGGPSSRAPRAAAPAAASLGRLAALAGAAGEGPHRPEEIRQKLDGAFEAAEERNPAASIPVQFDPETKKLLLSRPGEEAHYLDRGTDKLAYVPAARPGEVIKVFYSENASALVSRIFRFLERRNVARLAGIAAGPRLLASGETENGHPYLVTERVFGRPLKDWVASPGRLDPAVEGHLRELLRRLAESGIGVYELDGLNIMVGVTASRPTVAAYVIDATLIHRHYPAVWLAGAIERTQWLRRALGMPGRDIQEAGLVVSLAGQSENIRKARAARLASWLAGQKEAFDEGAPLTPPGFAAVGLASFGIAAALATGRIGPAVPAALAAAPLFLSSGFRESYRAYIKEGFGRILVGFQYRDGKYSPAETFPAVAWRLAVKSMATIPLFLAGFEPAGPGPYWLIGLSLVGAPAAAHFLGLGPAAAARFGALAAAAGAVGLSLLAIAVPSLGLAILVGGTAFQGLRWAIRRLLGRRGGAPAPAEPWTLEDAVFWAGVALALAGTVGPFADGALYKIGLVMGLGSGLFPALWPKTKQFFARRR